MKNLIFIAPLLISVIIILLSYDKLDKEDYLKISLASIAMIYLVYIANNAFFALRFKLDKKIVTTSKAIAGISMLLTIFLFVLIGIPGLSDDPNASKMATRDYPLLVRFFRYVGVIPAYVYIFSKNSSLRNETKRPLFTYLLTMSVFGFLLGFKGYAFIYILPMIYIYLENAKISYPIWLIIPPISVLYITASIEGLNTKETIDFIIDRLGATQLIGSTVLLNENLGNFSYYPPFSEFYNVLARVLGDSQTQSIQQAGFSYINAGTNELGMEIANIYLFEYTYAYGFYLGSTFFIIIMITLYASLKFTIKRSKNPLSLALTYMVFINFQDGLFSGRLFFKAIDVLLIIVLIIFLIKIYKILVLKFPKKT